MHIIQRLRNRIKKYNLSAYRIFRDIFVNYIGGGYFTPLWLRKAIYNAYSMDIRTKSVFPKCFFGGKKIHIGETTFINYGCFFDASDSIWVGDNCRIAMKCCFVTSSHEIGDGKMRASTGVSAPIKIEDGCWIGANVTILPGVTVGKGTIIAAGAVVVKDCDENSIYAGVPARKIKSI